MARLTIAIGSQSASIELPDANAATLVNDIVEATGGPVEGTAKQRGLWVLRQLAEHLRLAQRRQIHTRKDAVIRAELDTELGATGDWTDV